MTEERNEEQRRVDGLEAEISLLKLKHQSLAQEMIAIEDRLWAIENPVKGELSAARSVLELKQWRNQVNSLPPATWTNPTHEPKGGVWKITPKQVHIAIAAIPNTIICIHKSSGRLDLEAMGIKP